MGPIGAAAAVVSAGATLLGAFSQASAAKSMGAAQQQEENYKAAVGTQEAGQALATGQSQAIVARDKEALVLSNARAAAAASGGGASDPSVITNAGRIGARGEYDALSDIYTSTERSNALQQGAELDTYQGSLDASAGNIAASGDIVRGFGGAVGTIAGSKSVQSMYDKYAAQWNVSNMGYAAGSAGYAAGSAGWGS